MKAEHRKELETNALADRVGRAVPQGHKQAPQKKTLVLLVLIGVVALVGWLFVRNRDMRRNDASEQWVMFDYGYPENLDVLKQKNPQSTQSKAAQFEYNYAVLRVLLKLLANNPKDTLNKLEELDLKYNELAALSKDDKVLNPEALFALAVIAETRIIKSESNWRVAQAAFQTVVEKHPDSAFGKLAQKRLDILNDEAKRKKLLDIYQDLRFEFVREERMPLPPPDIMPFDPPLKGPDLDFIPK